MRVLIADKLHDAARTRLAASGFEVRAEPGLSGEALVARLAELDPEILVVRSTAVTEAHTLAGPRLSLIVRGGAGVNTIDVAACSRRGIFVANCPGKNAVAVAELTLALALALDRSIPDNVSDLRAGRWDKARYAKGRGLSGRTLGILGVGAIGEAVAERAAAFGMTVVGWSRSLTDAGAARIGIVRLDTPQAVARRADVLSIHLALTPETRGLIGESIFSAMAPGSLFLNTSRAEVVDEGALQRALERGIRAGLDVFSGEPTDKTAPFSHPLASHPSVYGTHHIGASTEQAQLAVGDEICRIAETFRDEGRVINGINRVITSSASHRLVVRHLDQVGVLARILEPLSEAGINVQEMENIVFPAGAAIARIQISSEPSPQLLEALQALSAVLNVSVVTL
ncbi:MAG TPA: ACT domain-containing protein [Deltaproteobacteria bacterium]|nr:ACT domain-containing protein [Deltaproteobacteria bacterium]